MKEWLTEREFLDETARILGVRVQMQTCRKYKAMGLVRLETRRVPAPTRRTPTRSVALFRRTALDELRFVAAGLSEGMTLTQIREARVRIAVEMARMASERAVASENELREVLATQVEDFDAIERAVDDGERNRRLDFYIKQMPADEQMKLLRAASQRQEDEGRQQPLEFYNRQQALHHLGGGDDELATQKLSEWFERFMDPSMTHDLAWWRMVALVAEGVMGHAMKNIRDKDVREAYAQMYYAKKFLASEQDKLLRYLAEKEGMTPEEYKLKYLASNP